MGTKNNIIIAHLEIKRKGEIMDFKKYIIEKVEKMTVKELKVLYVFLRDMMSEVSRYE